MNSASLPTLPRLPTIPLVGSTGSGQAGFNPADFAPSGGSLFLDLNADEFVTADGQPISSETDSVAGVTFTSTGTERPTMQVDAWNGHNGINFGIGDYLQSEVFSAPVTQPWTAVFLAKLNVIDPGFIVLADGISNTPLMMMNNNLLLASTNFVAATTGLLQDFYHCIIYVYNGVSSRAYMNGRQVATGNFDSAALDGLTLGAANNLTSALFNGTILRTFVYNGAMSAGEVTALNDAVRDEYHLNGGYIQVDTTTGGQNTRIFIPDNRRAGLEAIVYCHGLGENETAISDAPSSDKILYLLELLSRGYVVSASALSGNSWSNSTAVTNIQAQVAHLVSNYAIPRAGTWSQSAGGPIGLRMLKEQFAGVTVPAWFGIYPVCDLDWAHDSVDLGASVDAAFPSYPADAVGADPMLFAAADYNGKYLRACASPDDTVVSKADNSDALMAFASGATVKIVTETTGEHGDASNFVQAIANECADHFDAAFA